MGQKSRLSYLKGDSGVVFMPKITETKNYALNSKVIWIIGIKRDSLKF